MFVDSMKLAYGTFLYCRPLRLKRPYQQADADMILSYLSL